MKLIVGLGNPGNEYSNNRHNVGFMLLDYFASEKKTSFKEKQNYFLAQKDNFVLIKPTTYMNLSGVAVKNVLNQYKDIDDFVVVVDDIYLPLGEIRIKQKGGDGGHNGLKSVIAEIGNDEFGRIKIGVGSSTTSNLADYVLSDFEQSDLEVLKETFKFSKGLLDFYTKNDYKEMLNIYSRSKKSYSEKISKISESTDQRRNHNE